jgi:membrane associated rhomboid family serine protease
MGICPFIGTGVRRREPAILVAMATAELETRTERRAPSGLVIVGAMAALMWVVEVLDAILPANLDRGGIQPRDVDGLSGIVFAPFLHGSFAHLLGNTVPFLVLGVVIALGGAGRVVAVTVVVALVGGLGTWLFGPGNSVHIGASGIVFGYAAYLVARFYWSRNLLHLAAGIAVALVWGSTLMVGFVPTPGVSWQGHLFGAIGGLVAARFVHPRAPDG